MTKRKRTQASAATPQPSPDRLRRFPTWVWVLIFALPLIVSELMFLNAGRVLNMVLFPIAWVIFWGAILYRAGWPILRRR